MDLLDATSSSGGEVPSEGAAPDAAGADQVFAAQAGALVAGGGDGAGDSGPGRCHNCQAELVGAFCHVCGQKHQNLDIRFTQLLSEWLGGVIGFDARIWRTLRVLFTRPGQLTVDYFEGRRARYVAPLRLYLVASLFMALSMAWSGQGVINYSEDGGGSGMVRISGDKGDDSELSEKVPSELTLGMEEAAPSEAVSDEARSDDASADEDMSDDVAPADGSPSADSQASANARAGKESAGEEGAGEEGAGEEVAGEEVAGEEVAGEEGAGEEGAGEEGAGEDGESEVPAVLKAIGQSLENLGETSDKDRKAFDKSFRENLPQALFALVPVFALQLWVLFRRRYQRYLFHLIFSLHCHAAVFFMITVTRPIDALLGLPVTVGDFGGLAFFAYFFMAVRRVYGDSRLAVGFKMFVLMCVHGMLLGFALLAALVLAAWRLQG